MTHTDIGRRAADNENSAALNKFRSYIPDLEENMHSRIYQYVRGIVY